MHLHVGCGYDMFLTMKDPHSEARKSSQNLELKKHRLEGDSISSPHDTGWCDDLTNLNNICIKPTRS